MHGSAGWPARSLLTRQNFAELELYQPGVSNPNATYTPPGWRRGILLMVLLAVSTVVCLIAVLLPIVLADVPMVETAPYRYPVTGDPDIDGATLRAAVLFGALISGISAVIVLPIFVLLHRWLIRQPLRELHDSGAISV